MKTIFKNLFKKKIKHNEIFIPIDNRSFIRDLQINYQHFIHSRKKYFSGFVLNISLLPIISIFFNPFISLFSLILFVVFWGFKHKTYKHNISKNLALITILDYLNNPYNQKHIIEFIKHNNYDLQPNELNFFVSHFSDYFKNNTLELKNIQHFFDYLKEYQLFRHYDNEEKEIENFSEQYDKFFNQKEKNS